VLDFRNISTISLVVFIAASKAASVTASIIVSMVVIGWVVISIFF